MILLSIGLMVLGIFWIVSSHKKSETGASAWAIAAVLCSTLVIVPIFVVVRLSKGKMGLGRAAFGIFVFCLWPLAGFVLEARTYVLDETKQVLEEIIDENNLGTWEVEKVDLPWAAAFNSVSTKGSTLVRGASGEPMVIDFDVLGSVWGEYYVEIPAYGVQQLISGK